MYIKIKPVGQLIEKHGTYTKLDDQGRPMKRETHSYRVAALLPEFQEIGQISFFFSKREDGQPPPPAPKLDPAKEYTVALLKYERSAANPVAEITVDAETLKG